MTEQTTLERLARKLADQAESALPEGFRRSWESLSVEWQETYTGMASALLTELLEPGEAALFAVTDVSHARPIHKRDFQTMIQAIINEGKSQ